ncbi:hypothetical protein KJ673_03105 [Patescibacteria group bacterium]|nr:hypothetical protein [Patescibacteria group bacterium]MCG2687190.1 hypothetical protein [Candidatus Parcubacteria bacterium]
MMLANIEDMPHRTKLKRKKARAIEAVRRVTAARVCRKKKAIRCVKSETQA